MRNKSKKGRWQNDKKCNKQNRWGCKRERERERVILTKLCSVNHAQKLSGKYIRNRGIGYVDSVINYVR